MKYRVEVHTTGDPVGSWSSNQIRHDTPEAAASAATDLFFRWTAVEWWRVIDENDLVSYTNGPVTHIKTRAAFKGSLICAGKGTHTEGQDHAVELPLSLAAHEEYGPELDAWVRLHITCKVCRSAYFDTIAAGPETL